MRWWLVSKSSTRRKNPDPTGVLAADCRDLVFDLSVGEEDAGLCAWCAYDDPPLGRPSLVWHGESSASSNPSAW
jgi:hypothetical protein